MFSPLVHNDEVSETRQREKETDCQVNENIKIMCVWYMLHYKIISVYTMDLNAIVPANNNNNIIIM